MEILKPDAVLRAERVPVGQMGDVFSGGQLLTAAIALYCTMAALRSNDRGRDRHRHAGTLFLDNPIGRANATYLLELQRAVADALGVQLLYTTGLFDTTALAEFPLVIRLRNDADLRAGPEVHQRRGAPAARACRSRTRTARRCTARSPPPGCSAARRRRPRTGGPAPASEPRDGTTARRRRAPGRGTPYRGPAAIRRHPRGLAPSAGAARRSRRSARAALLGLDTTPLRWFHTCRVTHTSSTAQVATTVLATCSAPWGTPARSPPACTAGPPSPE